MCGPPRSNSQNQSPKTATLVSQICPAAMIRSRPAAVLRSSRRPTSIPSAVKLAAVTIAISVIDARRRTGDWVWWR